MNKSKKLTYLNTIKYSKPMRKTRKLKIVESLNTKIISVLDQMSTLLSNKGEVFRARAYKKALETIICLDKEIIKIEDIKGMATIGNTIYDNIKEYIENGKLEILENEKNNPVNKLCKVYGIGPKRAQQFVDNGYVCLDDLRQHPEELTTAMKLGLKYFDEIEEKIPRSEIEIYETKIDGIFKELEEKDGKYEIVGSYRRGKKESGDIDIIITGPTSKVYEDLLNKLIEKKMIIEILSRGKIKCLTIGRLDGGIARRLDFMYSPPDEYAFATLYFTGSKIFNTIQRQIALNKGYTLNEHGIQRMSQKQKIGEKLNKEFPNEEAIFNFLDMEYVTPQNRIDKRSVKYIKKELKEDNFQDNSQDISQDKFQMFKNNGISYLNGLAEIDLNEMIKTTNTSYYENNLSILNDNEYDILCEFTKNKFPKNTISQEGHINIEIVKNKTTLPYEMWSLDKIKPDTDALDKFKEKYTGPYIISCKLDGVSGLYTTEDDKPKLYTRGNGKVGQDISHLIPFLKLPTNKNIVIRGEFIIKKDLFNNKYSDTFSNARNFVAGVINQKKIDPNKFKDLDFVAYELIHPIQKPSHQLINLDNLNVDVVKANYKDNISNQELSSILIDWRKDYDYEIDGLVCYDDRIYKRGDGNPDHAFAFKMVLTDQIAEAKVIDVIWSPSKDGYLKPRVQIEPVHLSGAKIEYATGFNGNFINQNKIGVGALIKIIRSGDVIPHILEVVQPASTPLMPNVPYKWTDGNIDIELIDKENDSVIKEKIFTAFFKNLGVEGLGPGNVKKIINAGYNTIPKIIHMSVSDYENIDGFKSTMANKLYKNIHTKLDSVPLPDLMTATHIFGRGFGTKKFVSILEKYPDIIISNISNLEKIRMIASINGMSVKSATTLLSNIPKFILWIKEANLNNSLVYTKPATKNVSDTSHPLYNKIVVTTGVSGSIRNALSKELEKIGAILENSLTKNTNILVANSLDVNTDKFTKAKKLNIPIIELKQFIKSCNF